MKKIKLGDIFEINLPNGMNAYGRLYQEGTLGIYKKRCFSIDELPQKDEYDFFVTVYDDLLTDGVWKVVGNRPFKTEDESWPPLRSIRDIISGEYSLYVRGEIIPSTEKICKNLERVAVWDRHHVIDRIMGDNKWNPI